MSDRSPAALTAAYLRWAFTRALLARGYWSTTAVYLVVVAELDPSELVLIGVFQALTALIAEVPAGILADTVGRRATLVAAQIFSGAGMVLAGLVTEFPLLVLSQCLWGAGWALASGADVAWLTDELRPAGEVDRTLVTQSRWELIGNPIGMAAFAALAWATTLSLAIVTAGALMGALALVVGRWPETGFVRDADTGPVLRSVTTTLRVAIDVARGDRMVRSTVIGTAFVFGGVQAFGRLREQRLLALGMPTEPDPVVWFAALGVIGFVTGAILLRVLEGRIDRPGAPRVAYVLAALAGAVGLLLVALVGSVVPGAVATVLVMVADPLVRTSATIAVNRRTDGNVRATVHSLLWQSAHVGTIIFGLSLAAIAAAASTAASLAAAASLLVGAALLVVRARQP